LLLTYGALVVPAIFASGGLSEAAPQPAGSTYELRVTGQAGVPADASAVVLNITSAGATGTGYITAWPCGATRPNASNLNYGVGAPVANSAIVRIGSGGKVCLFTADNPTELIVDINGWFPAGSDYPPTTPARLLDSRPGLSTVDSVAAGVGIRRAGGVFELQVTGRSGVPASASAVVLNITSAEARGVGFITAFPCGSARPIASNLNYGVGAPVANSAVVKVGTGGKVCLFTGDTDTELIADVNGWFVGGGDYSAVAPQRLLDTRNAGASGAAFAETFGDGEGWRARWDLDVHHRDDICCNGENVNTTTTWRADHDMNCGGADTIRTINAGGDRSQHFWMCGPPAVGNAHVMTSVGDVDGYSTVSMAPKQAFPAIRRVCWDQNVTDLGGRQWTEVLVVPAAKIADGDLTHVNPDFVSVDEWTKQHSADTWGIMVHGEYAGLVVYANGVNQADEYYQAGRDQAGQESRSIRRQHCLTDNGNGTVTVSIDQGASGVYQRNFAGHFPSNARVILEQHAYTPDKDGEACRPVGALTGCRYTWHWDNITVD
jgi:hypothetical protein